MSVQPSQKIDLPRLIDCADYIVRATSRILSSPNEEFRGGYLVVHEVASNSVELLIRLGSFNPEKAPQQIEFAMEKAARLHLYILASQHDFASYDTRDPDKNLWGGAINAHEYIYSFSGLPELWDEAAMFVLAIHLGNLQAAEVLEHLREERRMALQQLLHVTRKWYFEP